MEFMKSHGVAVLGAVVLASLVALATHGRAIESPVSATPHDNGLKVWLKAGMSAAAAEGAVPGSATVTGVESLPASLRGTEVAGELSEDTNGNLKVTRGVREVFDYFLTAQGEEPANALTARIEAYVRSKLTPRAASQAISLLARYRVYKDRVMAVVSGKGGSTLQEVLARRDAVLQVRRTSFDPTTYDAFFGADEALDNYSVDRFALMQDPSLSPQDKAARLAAARASLPAEVRDAMGAAEVVQTLNALTEQLNQRGGTPQELRALRVNLVGTEAADRLDVMDREDVAWQRRVDDYFAQANRLHADTSLSESARLQQLDQLRSGFGDSERVRIAALEATRAVKSR
jgi:lipase chaperone LimK